jgi:2-methylcitrate dehydratase PrpD
MSLQTRSSISATLASEIAALELADVPEHVRERAKLLILDTLGVQLAAVELESSRTVIGAMVDLGGAEEAGIVGSGRRVAAPNAALANGALVHALDFDDTHLPAQVHVSGGVLPAALAAAERRSCSGADLLAGFIAGAEVSVRVGMAAPGRFNDNGYHATGVCGAFGAAAAAARVMGLDAGRLAHALGLAGSQASGTMAFLDDPGSWVKRLHPGWAAHAGYYAAFLAGHGYTGPAGVFEAAYGGLYASHVRDGFDPGVLTAPLEDHWQTARIGLKPYPTGQFNIPFMDAARRLVDEEGIALEDIDRIVCHIAERAVATVCEPLDAKRRPETGYAGKFSLPYSVAAMLVRGRATLREFEDEAARDEAILRVSDKIEYVIDPDADFPRYYPAWVVVVLEDGRELERREPINLGHPENPLSAEQVLAKFRANAERLLDAATAGRLAELVLDLEAAPDVAAITRLACAR